MKKSIYPLQLIFNLNERLFLNTLDGMSDEMSTERITDHNNSFTWIATHTVWARYNAIIFLGKPVKNPYEGMFENFKPYTPADAYPTLETLEKEWKKASVLLKEALEATTEEHLATEASFKNPTGDFSNIGAIAFLAEHESYDIGQMAFLKKYHSKEAMKYS